VYSTYAAARKTTDATEVDSQVPSTPMTTRNPNAVTGALRRSPVGKNTAVMASRIRRNRPCWTDRLATVAAATLSAAATATTQSIAIQ
jgi:hypothetical protein